MQPSSPSDLVDMKDGTETRLVSLMEDDVQEGGTMVRHVQDANSPSTAHASGLSGLTPSQKELAAVVLLQRAFRQRRGTKAVSANKTPVSPSTPFSKDLPASKIARLLVKALTAKSLRDNPRPLTRRQATRDAERTADIYARQRHISDEGASHSPRREKKEATVDNSQHEHHTHLPPPHAKHRSTPEVLFVHSKLFVKSNGSQKVVKKSASFLSPSDVQQSPPVSPKAVARRLLQGSGSRTLTLSPRGPKPPSGLRLESNVSEGESNPPAKEIRRKNDARELPPYTEEHQLAAITLQRAFRKRQSHQSVDDGKGNHEEVATLLEQHGVRLLHPRTESLVPLMGHILACAEGLLRARPQSVAGLQGRELRRRGEPRRPWYKHPPTQTVPRLEVIEDKVDGGAETEI